MFWNCSLTQHGESIIFLLNWLSVYACPIIKPISYYQASDQKQLISFETWSIMGGVAQMVSSTLSMRDTLLHTFFDLNIFRLLSNVKTRTLNKISFTTSQPSSVSVVNLWNLRDCNWAINFCQMKGLHSWSKANHGLINYQPGSPRGDVITVNRMTK